MPNKPLIHPKRSGRLAADNRVDAAADAFERELRGGGQPAIEDHLRRCDPAERPTLLTELILLEAEYRRAQGETPTRDEYRQRFPEFPQVISELDLSDPGETATNLPHRGPQAARPDIRRIKHFELLECVGEGAFGEVWRANDESLQRTVAVKIPRSRQLSPAELARFAREGRAAAQLSDRRIVAVHEVGDEDGTAYIVSDFIDGQTLRELLEENDLTPREAAVLCAELAEALHHAHEHGVIHRDFKPGNVLMDRDGRPHITDFGLAKWSEDSLEMTLQGDVLGTPAFMSPEQARGDSGGVDRRTDVYALGAVLYAMLTGGPPFTGAVASVMHRVDKEEPPPPRSLRASIPRDLETICLKAIAKERERRYATAGDMADDLRRFLQGESIIARRAGLMERTLRWMRRRPALTAAAAALIGLAVAIAVVLSTLAENRALRGLRTVSLTTEPPGARVVFVPLSEATGEPLGDKRIEAPSRSPVEVELLAGDYLVVAALDDGRFHEVFRRVPDAEMGVPMNFDHLFWRYDDSGRVVLPEIDIPSASVTDDMVLIEMNRLPKEEATVPPFFIDPDEFMNSKTNRAMSASYDEAVVAASRTGKRLPSEAEFEAALAYGRHIAPDIDWESSDRMETNPPVRSLLHGATEWTTTWAIARSSQERPSLMDEVTSLFQYRIARGGMMEGEGELVTGAMPKRYLLHRLTTKSGLGFRCVRSARPRFLNLP